MKDLSLLPRTKLIHATLDLPGSKSIANRVLLLAAIAEGTSVIHNVPDVSEDVTLMLNALKDLGVKITKLSNKNANRIGSSSYKIKGCNGKFSKNKTEIFCGNSGTSIRFLTAILALMPGNYSLTGIERMKERPIKDLVEGLRQMGASINYLEKEGYPPILTAPFKDNGVSEISLSGKLSSQFLTGVLMALPLLERQITVNIYDELISKPYIDITIGLLAKFGFKIGNCNGNYYVEANSKLRAIEYVIEPDASSASYFLAMGALNGSVTINNLSINSLQGDKHFAHILQQMGASVIYTNNSIAVSYQGRLDAIEIDMQQMPDVAMTIAVLALFAEGVSTIRGIGSWRVKETDRLQAMYNELTKLGAVVNITDNSITIMPPPIIKPNVEIDTYNDHRMAMCFSLLAVAGTPVTIKDYKCVGKTFANYFELFNSLCY